MANPPDVPWADAPWLPYQVTAILERIAPRTVFEWGSGGSTLFFIKGRARRVVSVESDPAWYHAVHRAVLHACPWGTDDSVLNSATLSGRGLSWQYWLRQPDPSDIGPDPGNPAHYKSASTELGPCNFLAYVSTIDQYETFDLVLIDGMARASCIAHAMPHVAPGGWLVLDNVGDRPYYLAQTLPLLSGWERIDVTGFGPLLDYQWTTALFRNVQGKAGYYA